MVDLVLLQLIISAGLSAGGYSIFIEDAAGCQFAYGSANINDPSPINIDSTVINFI